MTSRICISIAIKQANTDYHYKIESSFHSYKYTLKIIKFC
ncbi:hypothetical protein ADIWIN_3743 [Winogradskyella psychrotolerans RS-3]|uniref:Uncharacterized protein n=1 Tax=Winogradskyella psychrotolerans RS-3 TaxID=641526 RepID=S7VLR1_9FLAO|nr:hypothetical protein ADIWIN_3743 [Winogradskyella psychrotolerans RS-3]